jgi:hypothetical protein
MNNGYSDGRVIPPMVSPEGDRLAKISGNMVDWKNTPLGASPGAQDSDPWVRLWSRAEPGDRAFAVSEDDDPAYESQEEQEQEHSDENDSVGDSVRTLGRFVLDHLNKRLRGSDGRSCAMDAAISREFLDPEQDVRHALYEFENRLAHRQRDSSTRGFWAGLRHYLSQMPAGSTIRDCNQATLLAVLRPLRENVR